MIGRGLVVMMLISVAGCAAGNSLYTSQTSGPVSWGDCVSNLQIGLAIIQSQNPKPLPDQYQILLRNTGPTVLRITCPPQRISNDQIVPAGQSAASTALMTLSFTTDSSSLIFSIVRPDPPKLTDLKPGDTIAIALDLSLDLHPHPGLNTVSFRAGYSNMDTTTSPTSWTGSIQSPTFTITFSR
jgi:hypothetical protein